MGESRLGYDLSWPRSIGPPVVFVLLLAEVGAYWRAVHLIDTATRSRGLTWAGVALGAGLLAILGLLALGRWGWLPRRASAGGGLLGGTLAAAMLVAGIEFHSCGFAPCIPEMLALFWFLLTPVLTAVGLFNGYSGGEDWLAIAVFPYTVLIGHYLVFTGGLLWA